MTMDTVTVLIVITLGAFLGTGVGLVLGYLGKKQKRGWEEMSRREKLINIALVVACSAVAIAGLAWYASR